MINPYCGSLDGVFSQLVYFGLLKEEDSQCFRTDVSVEPTFYILFTAAIALALMNSFVMNAVSQYFRDGEADAPQLLSVLSAQQQKVSDLEDLEDLREFEDTMFDVDDENTTDKQAIHPVPVLFTDRYRWFLHREDAMTSRRPSETDGSFGPEPPTISNAMPPLVDHAVDRTSDDSARRVYTIVNIPAEDENHPVHDDMTSDDEHVYTRSLGDDEEESDIVTDEHINTRNSGDDEESDILTLDFSAGYDDASISAKKA